MRRKQGPVERVLRKARGLIAVGWTRSGRYHIRRRGVDCYCIYGATYAAAGGFDGPNVDAATSILFQECERAYRMPPVSFNDAQRTRKPVLALFDRAIAKAKEGGL